MDLLELYDDEECIEETSADHFLSPDAPATNDIYGDPPVLPRIGDQYQVELPPLKTESEHLQQIQCPTDTDGIVDVSVGIGLAIPIMWVCDQVDDVKHELKEFAGAVVGADKNCESSKKSCMNYQTSHPVGSSNGHGTFPQPSTCNVEALDHKSDHDRGFTRLASHKCFSVVNQMDMGMPWMQWRKPKGYIPLPGSQSISWSDAETECFLLSLYIFGKNLVLVRRFMESKDMGDILSFYYGKFYRSDAHRRWSECRKIRSRRCINGQRIFTGWRQQELLSRLVPKLPAESQNALLEATKTFSEGRTSLEEYVFTLKATVSMKILVEAVGIGKGKHDLTGIVLDPVRTNQVISVRSEIPVGKACSSLSSGEIIKFLTGDFRLSKARSNDLFWEAVWPRLLARGWHSEQPKNHGYASSKHALVFLIPGVKKFSRRKLVKGNHYFDSVSDVLNKVASEPGILELEVEGTKGNSRIKDEDGWVVDAKMDQNGPSDHQRHCYLRPRLPNCNSELMKVTVVDTSLVQGEAPYKVRELRTLPVYNTCHYALLSLSGEMESKSSKEQSDSDDTSLNDQEVSDEKKLGNSTRCMLDKGVKSDIHDHVDIVSKGRILINGHDSDGQYHDLLNNHPMKDIKCQFGSRVKSGRQNYLDTGSKRRRLTACRYTETCGRTYTFSRGQRFKMEPSCLAKSIEANNTVVAAVGSSRGKISASSSTKGSPNGSSECVRGRNYASTCTVGEAALSDEKPQPRTLIDLNIPQFPLDFEESDPFSAEVADSQDVLSVKAISFASETTQHPDDSQTLRISNGMRTEQQPSMNARRQSTRNRPPTTRALEALASGFLSTRRRRRRGTNAPPSGNSASRSSRRARNTVEALVSHSAIDHGNVISEITDPKGGEVDEECSSNNNHVEIFNNSHIQSERKGTRELLGVP